MGCGSFARGGCCVAKKGWSVDDLPERYQQQVLSKIGKVRPNPQLEIPFMEQAIEFLRICGWLVYHTKDSRKSAPGFPDIVALKGEAPARRRDEAGGRGADRGAGALAAGVRGRGGRGLRLESG
jgi:hypothetical protein